MSLTQKKPVSRFRLLPYQIPATLFRLWQRGTNGNSDATGEVGATTEEASSSSSGPGPGPSNASATITGRVHPRGVGPSRRPLAMGNRRRMDENLPSTSGSGPRLGRVGSQTTSRMTRVKRSHRVGVADVRAQLQQQNVWRKERSFRNILEQDQHHQLEPMPQSQAESAGDDSLHTSDFPALAKEVRRAFVVTSKVPMTEEEWVFNKELGNLCSEHVEATRVVDPGRADEMQAAFAEDELKNEREVFLSLLEKERKQVDEIMKRREAENMKEKAQREEEERLVRLEDEARQVRAQFEREAERQRILVAEAEAARRAAEMRARKEARARREAEEQARAYAEDQARLRAELDNMARLQEEKLRKHVEEYERLQAVYEAHLRAQIAAEEAFVAQAKAQWDYFVRQQQQQQQQYDNDILMRDPSFTTSGSLADISMAYIPLNSDPPTTARLPSPPPYVPPPPPQSSQGWFTLYESRWQEIRSSTTTLSFAHFPWPVFRLISCLEELDERDIKDFFAKKYARSRKLGKSWKEELRRWHTDKFVQVAIRIRPEELAAVQEGFSRCIKVMTVFQTERNMNLMAMC